MGDNDLGKKILLEDGNDEGDSGSVGMFPVTTVSSKFSYENGQRYKKLNSIDLTCALIEDVTPFYFEKDFVYSLQSKVFDCY